MACTYIALYNLNGQSALQLASIHPFTHTDGDGAAMQGAGESIGSNLGFGVLPKDSSTCGQEEMGIEPPTQRLVDDLLYLL